MVWFKERAAAFVESCGMVGVADALTDAVPALKHGAEAMTPPGVWFRASDLVMKLIVKRHGSVSETTMDEWFRDAGIEANESLRVLGILSCIRMHGGEATLWLIDAGQAQSADQKLMKRFDMLLGRAQECVRAGHVAAMEYFGCTVAPSQQPESRQTCQVKAQSSRQPAAPAQKPEVPKGKDPSFVPIKLQEPAGRYRPAKGLRP